jgi:hypothetical protein
MTNPIGRRLDRLESHVENETNPGYGPVFELHDDPRDPDNAERLAEAVQFRLKHPHGMIIHRIIISPPEGHSTWEQFHVTGTSAEIAKQQAAECSAKLDAMITKASVH